jgi:hypothetical protein
MLFIFNTLIDNDIVSYKAYKIWNENKIKLIRIQVIN